jgi:hypothetical protein
MGKGAALRQHDQFSVGNPVLVGPAMRQRH